MDLENDRIEAVSLNTFETPVYRRTSMSTTSTRNTQNPM